MGRTDFERWPMISVLDSRDAFQRYNSLLRSPSFEYDVTPDGQRFLIVEPAEKPEYLPLTLESRWPTKQARRVWHANTA